MADWVEGFVPMRLHVLIRFGLWREIIDEPLPADPELYCTTTAMMHYAKGVAHAVLGEIAAAEEHERAFRSRQPARVPDTRYLFNNTCADILAVAAEMLAGEIAYRRADFDEAFAHLRRSVELDDALPYDEPWGWMQPTRHALGALLLEQGRVEEAEAVYRADLGLDDSDQPAVPASRERLEPARLPRMPDRLRKPEPARIVKQQLDVALARADVPIKSSCFAAAPARRPQTGPGGGPARAGLEEGSCPHVCDRSARTRAQSIRQEPCDAPLPGLQTDSHACSRESAPFARIAGRRRRHARRLLVVPSGRESALAGPPPRPQQASVGTLRRRSLVSGRCRDRWDDPRLGNSPPAFRSC